METPNRALLERKTSGDSLSEALIQRMGLGVVIWQLADINDPASMRLVSANPAASRIAQFDFSSATGKTMGELSPSAVARGRHKAYANVALSGIEQPLEPDVYVDGGESVVSGRIVPLPDQCVGVIFESESSKARSKDEPGKLAAFLDSIVDNIPAMVFVKEAKDLRYELFNRTGETLTGRSREDMYGKDDHELFPDQAAFFQARDRDVLRDGRMLDIPEEPIDTTSGRRWLHTKKIPLLGPDGTPEHLLGISLDITDRKMAVESLQKAHEDLEVRVHDRTSELVEANAQLKLEIGERRRTEEALEQAEEQLRHAQKMEAVGRLAGGIAHDFNNLLSVIISYATVLAEHVERASQVRQGLDEIKRAGERAAILTRQLLAFSRQQVLAPRVVDLNEIIAQMEKMLRRLIGEDLDLCTIQAPDLGRIKADPGQLEQVIMNLAVNARDAMPEGGKLTIETTNVKVLESQAKEHPGVPPGDYVMLRVADTGSGIEKATMNRIFEPFFTTKEQGKGTGLGLSTVFGIVKQSGGHIWVDSEPGRGTTFKIYFAETHDGLVAEVSPDASDPTLRGSETILLVEDEEQVRTLAHKILQERGYDVLVASGPREALAMSAEKGGAIDLLITDIVMPQMNGRVLCERLLFQRPELKVLLMSGYAHSFINEGAALGTGIAFLQKPIAPLLLTKMVRHILDAKSAPKWQTE